MSGAREVPAGHSIVSFRKGTATVVGVAVCQCSARIESFGMNRQHAQWWLKDHPVVERAGRRSTATVMVEHDFDHIVEVARGMVARLASERGERPALTAWAVADLAQAFSVEISSGRFTDPQLFSLSLIPQRLGLVLASIDPERAR